VVAERSRSKTKNSIENL